MSEIEIWRFKCEEPFVHPEQVDRDYITKFLESEIGTNPKRLFNLSNHASWPLSTLEDCLIANLILICFIFSAEKAMYNVDWDLLLSTTPPGRLFSNISWKSLRPI